MALLMGAVMAGTMLGFMSSMYKNKAANVAIVIGAVAVFADTLYLVRSQQTVWDVDYMRAMIPHHSSAVLTSTQAHIKDPRVRELADEIIEAQVREIAEMKSLIGDLESNPLPADAPAFSPPSRRSNAAYGERGACPYSAAVRAPEPNLRSI